MILITYFSIISTLCTSRKETVSAGLSFEMCIYQLESRFSKLTRWLIVAITELDDVMIMHRQSGLPLVFASQPSRASQWDQ